jgi:hypothetical protein
MEQLMEQLVSATQHIHGMELLALATPAWMTRTQMGHPILPVLAIAWQDTCGMECYVWKTALANQIQISLRTPAIQTSAHVTKAIIGTTQSWNVFFFAPTLATQFPIMESMHATARLTTAGIHWRRLAKSTVQELLIQTELPAQSAVIVILDIPGIITSVYKVVFRVIICWMESARWTVQQFRVQQE